LGQTTTTDAVSGGHAVAKEHRQVQEDIERADAKALSSTLNRDLARPMIDLNFGPQKAYPRIVIARPEEEDVKMLLDAVDRLVPKGLRVPVSEMHRITGLREAKKDEEVLSVPQAPQPAPAPDATPDPKTLAARLFAGFKPKTAMIRKPDAIDAALGQAAPAMDAATEMIIERIRAMAEEASSLDDLQDKLLMLMPGLPEAELASAMGEALVLANLTGRLQAES
jgi:phage gp29-like protein